MGAVALTIANANTVYIKRTRNKRWAAGSLLGTSLILFLRRSSGIIPGSPNLHRRWGDVLKQSELQRLIEASLQIKTVVLSLLTPVLWAQCYTISTFAGGGIFPPLPAPSISTSVGYPVGIAADGNGNFYFSDPFLNVIYKVSSSGVITVLAGTGRPGYSGDSGAAINAQLNYPTGLAMDKSGNLYIADTTNSQIREVSTSGIMTTVAGSEEAGLASPGGIALDASGNLYIADTFHNAIRKISTAGTVTTIAGNRGEGYSGDGGPATQAKLFFPSSVAVDTAGNIYIADAYNFVIRKVDTTGTITTFAGNGTAGYAGDGGPAMNAELSIVEDIVTDSGGALYIVDGERVRQISPAGIITTIAGNGNGYSGDGGPATGAELNFPSGVALGANGSFYIADSENFRVREVSSSQVITTVAGNGSEHYSGDGAAATAALLANPIGVAAESDGTIYFSDSVNNRVRKISVDGIISTVAGSGTAGYSGDNGLAQSAELNNPQGLAIDRDGNVLVADSHNSAIRKISPNGFITTLAGDGTAGYSGDGGPATAASLSKPGGIAFDNSGNLFIADTYNSVIREVSAGGTITTVAGVFSDNSGYSGDNGPAVLAHLWQPHAVTIDGGGNLYIADTNNSAIRKVDTGGTITTIAGNGYQGDSGDNGPAKNAQLGTPTGLALDASGDLYIADSFNTNIRVISSTGIITTIAGRGFLSNGYSGDGGPALDATLNRPNQIAVGANGILYFADTYNNAIRGLIPVCIQNLPTTASADSSAQTLEIPIAAAANCNWSASNLPGWITSASSGTGPGNLGLSLQPNTTGVDLVATIAINGLPLTVTQRFTAQLFQDVPTSSYYFDAVNLLKTRLITSGCAVNGYCPSADVTRAQMAVFLVRAVLGEGTFTYSPTPHFTDVQPADFAFSYIQKLYELSITSGCGPALFCPNNPVTRAQMAVFIIRARYGSQTVFDYPPSPYFADVPVYGFGYNYIQRMKEDNVTSGCAAAAYCPDSPVIRGDMAIFIIRGAFNQLLPASEPTLFSVTPGVISNGASTTLTISGQQTNFVAGSTIVNAVPGLIVSNVTVLDPLTLQVNVTANTITTPQPLSIWITDPTEEAVLPNGLLVQ